MRWVQLLHAEAFRPSLTRRWLFKSVRYVHRSNPVLECNDRSEDPPARPRSLFDEIFTEKNENTTTLGDPNHDEIEIPRLPLSDLDPFSRRIGVLQKPAIERTAAPNQAAVKQSNPAVLVVSCASKSLVDADFRRTAPEGCRTGEWTGPLELLKGSENKLAQPMGYISS